MGMNWRGEGMVSGVAPGAGLGPLRAGASPPLVGGLRIGIRSHTGPDPEGRGRHRQMGRVQRRTVGEMIHKWPYGSLQISSKQNALRPLMEP